MLNTRNGVFAFQIFQLRVDIVIGQSRVCQYLKSQIVVALTRTAIQPPVKLCVHTTEHILTANSGGVIVRLPLRTQQAVSANPFDLSCRKLIVECPVEEAETVRKLVAEQMEHVMTLKVPLLAEAKIGESWYAAK